MKLALSNKGLEPAMLQKYLDIALGVENKPDFGYPSFLDPVPYRGR